MGKNMGRKNDMIRHTIVGAALVLTLMPMLAGRAAADARGWVCEPELFTSGTLHLTETSVTWNDMTIDTEMYTSGFVRMWVVDERNNVQVRLDAGGDAYLYKFGDKDRVLPSESWRCEKQ